MSEIVTFSNKGQIGATPITAENLNANIRAILEILGLDVESYLFSKTYEIDDLVVHNHKIYTCIEAITTPEEWDESKWEFCTLSELIIGKKSMRNLFPIGYIYISVNDVNPTEYFGGKWEQIKDVFLLACGNKYANGTTGGEESHTLTINEIPSHSHNVTIPRQSGMPYYLSNTSATSIFTYMDESTYTTTSTGSSRTHNNMPPYLTVYVWKKIG